jgi:uncharacterized protein with PQ loop repeat
MTSIIGYIATFVTGLSFMMKDLKTLRLVNALGCLIWILYGVLLNSVPIIITNVGIFGIHFGKLLKEKYIKHGDNK